MRGAEAVFSNCRVIGINAVKKNRIAKIYRVNELDEKLRIQRTKVEARLLNRAKIAGVKCPTVLEVSKFSIIMSEIKGKRPDLNKKTRLAKEAGEVLAKLHSSDVIHGDFTPANLIYSSNKMKRPSTSAEGSGAAAVRFKSASPADCLQVRRTWKASERSSLESQQHPPHLVSELFVIDFGLGFFSKDVEDKAIDVLTMLKSLNEKAQKEFLNGYSKYVDFRAVTKRVENVKSRARYV